MSSSGINKLAYTHHSMNEASSIEAHLRDEYKVAETGNHASDALAVDFKHDLHRGLKSRQIAMVVKLKNWYADLCRLRSGVLLEPA